MASMQQRRSTPMEKSRRGTSPSNQSKRTSSSKAAKRKNYGSEGVTDNDVFLLPGSDFQLLGLLTALAAVVRIFRIYQPTSVVFDEVQ
jgi:dolichyl-phosphate-mannose-protein mannosyltransferase